MDDSAASSLKELRKSYSLKKGFLTKNLQSAIESTQEVHSGWLKARTAFKRWVKVWCQVKPGYFIMYNSQEAQKKHRLGVLLLSMCQVMQRPTKKEGFCFKLINPFGCSVWAKSSTRALAFSQASLTLRASDPSIGKLWLESLQRCNLSTNLNDSQSVVDGAFDENQSCIQCNQSDISESDDGQSSTRQLDGSMLDNSKSTSNNNSISFLNNYRQPGNVNYVVDESEELGTIGAQCEEMHDGNKNLLWHIVKQLRIGMDLSKVTLPTFILEPRSFLEKLADYYYHCDILSEAMLINDPVLRLINIVKWYLSGFYKKPKGPKKPYNPILGERFRCFWDHPKTQSRTFFVAEQVSHHPPISAFHVSNRKDGYAITCALLSRSKFTGNSVSAILDGKAKLYSNRWNETYTLTMPYANCRGVVIGTLTLELGGKVEIQCVETGCKCELDFKLAPVWASPNSYNTLTGKIFRYNKVTHTLEGHWDKKITITDGRTSEKSVLWEVTDAVRASRLKRYTVSPKDQDERESVKLWSKVTEALLLDDQANATVEKTKLENMQRQEARDRQGVFVPQHFKFDPQSGDWSYKWEDNKPWDETRDIMQFEDNFKIKTLMFNSQNRMSPESRETLRGNGEMTHLGVADSNMKPSGSFKSIESRIDAENTLIKQAIKQITEQNKKLGEDLAALRQSKRTGAFVLTIVLVVIISVFFKYFV